MSKRAIKKIYFVTTNKHKWREAKAILSSYRVAVVQIAQKYEEDHDDGLEMIAIKGARQMAERLGKPVVVEDTGLWFMAWSGFPGALPKFIFNTLGYKGVFKLLAHEDRGAFFKTVAAYCELGSRPVVFSATMHGHITRRVFDAKKKVMPYDRIFIPTGEKVTISGLTLSKKNSISQRGKVFRQLGEWLAEKEKLITGATRQKAQKTDVHKLQTKHNL